MSFWSAVALFMAVITTGNSGETLPYPGATGTYTDKVVFAGFDQQGRAGTRTDGNGQVTTYTYENTSSDDGLLTGVSYTGASANDVTLDYDIYGRLEQVTDGSGTETYDLDDLGNLISKTTTYSSVTAQTFDYTYYPDGSRESMVNSAGTWTYYYDKVGRCRRMDSPADVSSTHFTSTFFDNGWQDRRSLPNGVYTDTTWNNLGLPDTVSNYSPSSVLKSKFDTFAYDGVFNMTSVKTSEHTVAGFKGTTDYEYDSKDRLTKDWSNDKLPSAHYSETFAYDGAGNPTTWKGHRCRSIRTTKSRARVMPMMEMAIPRLTPESHLLTIPKTEFRW